jgi:hypothetical protein
MELSSFEQLIFEMNESRGESGKGSKAGRQKYSSKDTRAKYDSKKSKVKVYPSIAKALGNSKYGEIFSTDAADRLYVTSKPKWGKKSTSKGNNKIAKGFTPGSSTPGASWDSIKGYAVRTMKKHGGENAKKFKDYRKDKEVDEVVKALAKNAGQALANSFGAPGGSLMYGEKEINSKEEAPKGEPKIKNIKKVGKLNVTN